MGIQRLSSPLTPDDSVPKLNLPPEFIQLQMAFARRMSELSGQPLEEALIDCTIIRTLLSINVTAETAAATPEWRTFIDGLGATTDQDKWAHDHYVEREKGEPELTAKSCFWYSYPFRDQPRIRLHFSPADRSGLGALHRDRMTRPTRRAGRDAGGNPNQAS